MDVRLALKPPSLSPTFKDSNHRLRDSVLRGSNGRRHCLRLFAVPVLFLFALLYVGSVLAGSAQIQSGHSAMWFDPARDGEGWVLEILSEDQALLYWFTYDEEGNQRWLQAVGSIESSEEGEVIEFPELYVTRGAEFGPNFNPDDVEREAVGVAAMTFEDCEQGTFSYTAFGQSQNIEIERLTQIMAAGCQPINGVPGQPIKEYAGQSGSWFDLSHNGEGYALQWMAHDQAVLTWYTYDSEGNQFWMVGVGHYEDGQIVFPSLTATQGARFGEAFDPDDVERFDWGSLVMELECSAGAASYDSNLPEFGSGDFDLNRLTQLKRPDCPWSRPKLSDLYEITWNEIPIRQGTPMDPNNIQAADIADDGTIAARRKIPFEDHWNLALWHPERQEWETLNRRVDMHISISPDGNRVLASAPIANGGGEVYPLFWVKNEGWHRIRGRIFDRSWPIAPSQDFSQIIGSGHDFGDAGRYTWVWDAEHGQRKLPLSEDIIGTSPARVANNGLTALGFTLREAAGGSNRLRRIAVRWEDGGEPRVMRDDLGVLVETATVCSADCSLVFGAGQTDFDPDHPHLGEAWYWMDSGEFAYLGALPDHIESSRAYGVTNITLDGALAVGGYATPRSEGSNRSSARAFIWTQRTGIVSVRTLVDELGIGDDEWERQTATGLSSDGGKILLQGRHIVSGNESPHWRAVVLELIPKETGS